MKHNFYIFRHSLATLSKEGYGDEVLTATILPEYINSIKKMAIFLRDVKTSSNFSSEILRCQQTTAIITEATGKKFNTDPRLNEYHNESFLNLSQRVNYFLEDLRKIESENILICTHGAIAAALKHIIINDSFSEDDLMDYPQCGELLIIKNKEVKYLDFNL